MEKTSLQPIDFTDFLVERRALGEPELLDVLAERWQHRGDVSAAIVARGYLTREEVERLRAEFDNLQVVFV